MEEFDVPVIGGGMAESAAALSRLKFQVSAASSGDLENDCSCNLN